MLIYNQDGSSAEMCGNATRCLAKLIYKMHFIDNIQITINSHTASCKIINKDTISVNMGQVKFNALWMPDQNVLFNLLQHYAIELQDIACVDIGNPHLIIFKELNKKDKLVIAHIIQDSNIYVKNSYVAFCLLSYDKEKSFLKLN